MEQAYYLACCTRCLSGWPDQVTSSVVERNKEALLCFRSYMNVYFIIDISIIRNGSLAAAGSTEQKENSMPRTIPASRTTLGKPESLAGVRVLH